MQKQKDVGMIYANHDFATNFFNAVGYKDTFMQRDIIIDELAKLIVSEDSKKLIVDMLRLNGFNVSVKDNNQKISNILSDQIQKKNEKIISALKSIIYDRNELTSLSADGTSLAKGLNLTDKEKIDLASYIETSLNSIFKKRAKADSLSNPITSGAELLSERVKLAEMHSADGVGVNKMPLITKIGIGVGVLSAIFIAIVIIKKIVSKKADSNKVGGIENAANATNAVIGATTTPTV